MARPVRVIVDILLGAEAGRLRVVHRSALWAGELLLVGRGGENRGVWRRTGLRKSQAALRRLILGNALLGTAGNRDEGGHCN